MGSRVPEEMKEQFRTMLDTRTVTVPSLVHYVKFIDSWRAGDYHSAFDNLHRYFDYTMHNRDRTFYQYALLNLAILQADFGCYAEAIAAMQETISTARENKDMICLNFSLSWLYHFGKAHPGEMSGNGGMLGVEREGLAFLRGKAKESGMWGLWSLSLLSEARLGLANGESVPVAFENILRSSHLNITKNITNTVGSQMLLQSGLWSRLGVSHLSWSYCEVFLKCHAHQAPVEDVLRIICKSASMLAQKGRYDDALKMLEDIDPTYLGPLKMYQYWATYSGYLRLLRELYRGNLDGASLIMSQLLSFTSMDPELAMEIAYLRLDLLMRRTDYSAAFTLIEELFNKMKDENSDIYQRVRLMIAKSSLYEKSGRPQKGFSIAVRAAAIAWRARLLPALWMATVAIAGILIELKEFDGAMRIMEAIMPQVLECEDGLLTARSFSRLVDAQMGLAGSAKAESVKRKEGLTKALEFIDRAFDGRLPLRLNETIDMLT
jgi:anaphase-promoting complex subunit 5